MIKSRKIKWASHVARMEEGRAALKMLTGAHTGKRRLGNIRMDLKEIGINMRNWVNSAQNRDYWRALVNLPLNLQIL